MFEKYENNSVNVLFHESQSQRRRSLDLISNEMVNGTCFTVKFSILQFLEPGNDRIVLEDKDADEVSNVDDDDHDEILDAIFDGDMNSSLGYVSPIYKKGNKEGKRGIKTPQKQALRNLFKESLNSGVAPRKSEVLKAQKTLRWPPSVKWTQIKSFICNNMKKRKRIGGRTGKKKNLKRFKRSVQKSEDVYDNESDDNDKESNDEDT